MAVIIKQLAVVFSALPTDSSALEASISALKSSISALESSLNTLEGSSTPWEGMAIVSAFVVFVGIVGEIIVIVSEDREDHEDWARGIMRPPSRAPRWRFCFDIVATVVVLLGVLGEASASAKLASINSQLRSKTSELRAKSDQLLALVTLEAGSAASSAVKAQGSANKVGLVADKAQAKADALSVREAKAESELEQQKQKTIAAETARLQMAEAMEPRHAGIIGTQRDELTLFSGTKFFITFASDDDSQHLSANIAGLLKGANWIAAGAELYPFSPLTAEPPTMNGGRNLTIITSASLDDGVVVMAKPTSWDVPGRFSPMNPQTGDAARLLCYVLKDSHVECDNFARYRRWPEGLPEDAVWVVIGRKPTAYFKWASDPEAQQAFIKMEKEHQTNSADDERSRAALLVRRRDTLNRK